MAPKTDAVSADAESKLAEEKVSMKASPKTLPRASTPERKATSQASPKPLPRASTPERKATPQASLKSAPRGDAAINQADLKPTTKVTSKTSPKAAPRTDAVKPTPKAVKAASLPTGGEAVEKSPEAVSTAGSTEVGSTEVATAEAW